MGIGEWRGAFSCCSLLGAAIFAVSGAYRVPLVIDTDIGQDCDDLWALMYSLARSDVVDLQMVLSATRNTTGRAAIVAKILETVGRTDVPVGIGVHTDPQGVEPAGVGPEWPWAGSYDVRSYPGRLCEDGVGCLLDLARGYNATHPLWVLEIAPVPNLEELLLRDASVAGSIRVVAMSGSVHVGYDGKPPISKEYNVAQNTSAAQMFYAAPWAEGTVTAPVDTSAQFQIFGDIYSTFYKAASGGNNLFLQTLLDNYQTWYDNGGKHNGAPHPFSPQTASSTLFDLQAARMLIELAQTQQKQRGEKRGREKEERGRGVRGGGKVMSTESTSTEFTTKFTTKSTSTEFPSTKSTTPSTSSSSSSSSSVPQFEAVRCEQDLLFVDDQGYTRIGGQGNQTFFPAVSWAGGVEAGVANMSSTIVEDLIKYSQARRWRGENEE